MKIKIYPSLKYAVRVKSTDAEWKKLKRFLHSAGIVTSNYELKRRRIL